MRKLSEIIKEMDLLEVMIQLLSKILEQTIQSDKIYDTNYTDLAESILNAIIEYDSDNEYYNLIDEIQILMMRKGYRFFTFRECEDIYNKIVKVIKVIDIIIQ